MKSKLPYALIFEKKLTNLDPKMKKLIKKKNPKMNLRNWEI